MDVAHPVRAVLLLPLGLDVQVVQTVVIQLQSRHAPAAAASASAQAYTHTPVNVHVSPAVDSGTCYLCDLAEVTLDDLLVSLAAAHHHTHLKNTQSCTIGIIMECTYTHIVYSIHTCIHCALTIKATKF